MSAPLSQLRSEIKKFWAEHPEASEALSAAYASSGANYKACVRRTGTTVTLDINCYRTQGASLSGPYSQLYGKAKK